MTAARRHFAVIAPPTPGHLNPLQVLGRELVARGHRVTFVHQADVAPLVVAAEAGFAALPDREGDAPSLARYNAVLAAPTGAVGLRRMIGATAALSDRLLEQAPAVLRHIGADAVIADSAEPAGALIGEALGLPVVIGVTGLPLLGEADVPPPFLGWRYRADAIGRFRNRGGYRVSERLMRPISDVLARHRRGFGLGERAADALVYVAQCPRALDYPRRHLPPGFHYGGPWRAPADEVAVELPEDGRPLIFCSLGTLQGARRSLFATMAQACTAIGARAVIGHGGGLTGEEAARLPGDPLVRAFWPQQAVLRRCAAAILHGGFNTVLDALAAGVPIVALPIAFEQPGTAARLAWAGAGAMLSPATSVDRLAATLEQVMRRPEYRAAALRLAVGVEAAGGAAAAAGRIDAAFA